MGGNTHLKPVTLLLKRESPSQRMISGLVFTANYFLAIGKKKTHCITIMAVTLLILHSRYQANLIVWYFPERANRRTWISENISHDKRDCLWTFSFFMNILKTC